MVLSAVRRRIPIDGFTRPYRPCPPDFRERYLELGWSKELIEHYRTNWRCIARWIEEAGGEELRQARAAISGSRPRPYRRSTAAVLCVHTARCGFRRSRSKAPTFWEVGLIRAETAAERRRRGPHKITVERAARIAIAVIEDGASEEFRAGVMAVVAAIVGQNPAGNGAESAKTAVSGDSHHSLSSAPENPAKSARRTLTR